MRVVLISDTHNLHDQVEIPAGDLLIHAGDLSGRGSLGEIDSAATWLRGLPHRHKIVIAGNHDFGLEDDAGRARPLLEGLSYLEDEALEIEGLKIWGSPWQPWFYDWAFQKKRGPEMAAIWTKIPSDTDLLITHGPPFGILDRTQAGDRAGCEDLLEALDRVKPRLHVFGHIHEAYGCVEKGETIFVNASVCNLRYQPRQSPIVIELSVSGPDTSQMMGLSVG